MVLSVPQSQATKTKTRPGLGASQPEQKVRTGLLCWARSSSRQTKQGINSRAAAGRQIETCWSSGTSEPAMCEVPAWTNISETEGLM